MGRGQCVAIVTGATRGFGQSLSVNFAKRMEQFAEEVIMVRWKDGCLVQDVLVFERDVLWVDIWMTWENRFCMVVVRIGALGKG